MATPQLFSGSGFDDFWEPVVLPWFRSSDRAWEFEKKAVVLVPDRSFTFFIKSCLLEAKHSFAGIYFLTPGECRRQMLAVWDGKSRIPKRELLYFLMAVAAETVLKGLKDLSSHSTLRSVAGAVRNDPSWIFRDLDRMVASGADDRWLREAGVGPILDEFYRLMERSGLEWVQKVDRELGSGDHEISPFFRRLLIFGFHAAHWETWWLLKAAVKNSEEPTVCLDQPRVFGERLDQLWQGTWEETFGISALPVVASREKEMGPFSERISQIELREKSVQKKEREIPIEFRIGENVGEEAESVVLQVLEFLAHPECERLGVVFPGRSVLSREVAVLLSRYEISFDDGLGYSGGTSWKRKMLSAWLELEKNPGFDSLMLFFKCRAENALSIPFPIRRIQKLFQRAFQEVLVDHPAVVSESLLESLGEDEQKLGRWISDWKFLSFEASWSEFLDQTREILKDLGLESNFHQLMEDVLDIPELWKTPLSKEVFLNWLDETLNEGEFLRDPRGAHPYSKVHLLTYAQAEFQEWSHLILTSLNESVWPRGIEGSPFLNERVVAGMNAEAIHEGFQGAGHLCLKSDRSLCLGEEERRELDQKQFYALIENVKVGLCVTASSMEDGTTFKSLPPSPYLIRLYWIENGEPLSEAVWDGLQLKTSQWKKRFFLDRPLDVGKFRKLSEIHRVRRNPEQAFGEYEFSLREPLFKPLTLGCKDWELAFKFPALVWMKGFLGVENVDFHVNDDHWPWVKGSWIHRWLERSINPEKKAVCLMPAVKSLMSNLERTAFSFRTRVEKIFERAEQEVPMWWTATWDESFWVVRRMANQLESFQDWTHGRTEWNVPRRTAIQTREGKLRILGRADLVLSRSAGVDLPSEMMVIDFKSGKHDPLTVSKLLSRGMGIQIVLYGMALKMLGCSSVEMAYVKSDPYESAVLNLEAVDSCEDLWRGLCWMQEKGVFGMREKIRDEYARGADFPVAMLSIENEVLTEKWNLTHSCFKASDE